MIVRKLRLEKGWSQEQLAEPGGLSVRMIQRIERDQNGGLVNFRQVLVITLRRLE